MMVLVHVWCWTPHPWQDYLTMAPVKSSTTNCWVYVGTHPQIQTFLSFSSPHVRHRDYRTASQLVFLPQPLSASLRAIFYTAVNGQCSTRHFSWSGPAEIYLWITPHKSSHARPLQSGPSPPCRPLCPWVCTCTLCFSIPELLSAL